MVCNDERAGQEAEREEEKIVTVGWTVKQKVEGLGALSDQTEG